MSLRTTVNHRLWKHQRLWRVAAAAGHPSHRGQRLRWAARAIRYDWRTIVRGKPTEIPLGERSRIVAYPGEYDPVRCLVHNPPEWPDMLVWRNRLGRGDLFLDVGANIGTYTLYALEQGADVIAVEPNPTLAARVREHLALNRVTAEVVEKAIADAPGTVRMTDGEDVLNRIVDTEGQATIEVPATTLDELLGDRRAAAKVDVEGAEELVLRGAARALAEQRITLLQLEWLVAEGFGIDNRAGCKKLLDDAGYVLHVSDESGTLHPLGDREPTGMNVFAVPDGRPRG
ncbi:FkbM family methyltransferase [Nocardioides sp. SYSU D00038]|uniref:FkbM family methyltransferase n=1 Tax=Nocardioides sp. SYSU D00038 TaxID=2812554 RepID=UPI00196834DE|nr:FkbM family methyltransferase [Nocardioides sp. SYSU D00038]